jgi:hypothetical protein
VFDTSIKFILESAFASKAKRLARLKDSLDSYLRLRKDFGDVSKWDTRIEVFAHSLAFGDGKLIERQYIDFAENSPEPEQVLLLHPQIWNFIECTDVSGSIKIRADVETLEKRQRFEIIAKYGSFLFLIVATVLGYVVHANYLNWTGSGLAYPEILQTIVFFGLILLILWIAPFMLFILPTKLAALNKFDRLLKDHSLNKNAAPVDSDSTT